MEYIKLNVTCSLCRANGHKRHQCPLRRDCEGKTRCVPGSEKYHWNMIQFLKNEIMEMGNQIDMINSEIELKKHLIEVHRSKAREAAALEAAANLASRSTSKKTSKILNKASNRHVSASIDQS